LAGIQFLSEAGYTQAEIDAIAAELLALYGDNDLAGLSEYVKSLTFRPGADGRTISLVGADGEQVATIITNSAGRVQILGDLTAGRDAAYDARNPYVPTPGPDYIDTKIGGIEFVTASSVEFSEEQVAAIQAQLDELDEAAVAGFAEYVERVTFGQNVQGEDGENFIIDVNTGEDATAVIYINYDATAAEIKAALDAAQKMVAAERARAECEAEEELARQASVIDELSTEFAGYISNITFADVEVPGYELDIDSDPVTASVTLPLNFTAEQGRRFIEDTVMESIESARDVDTNEPVDFLTLSFEGRETVLKAMPGIDQATIDAIYADTLNGFDELPEAFREMIVRHVASWTLVEETIDGGRSFVLDNDGRAIITADGSIPAIADIFLVAHELSEASSSRVLTIISARRDGR